MNEENGENRQEILTTDELSLQVRVQEQEQEQIDLESDLMNDSS